MRHYPDRFSEIQKTLKIPYPGALFLVGSGVFGKIYCEWIKQRGGIAIDVGSMFDSWANFGRVLVGCLGLTCTVRTKELVVWRPLGDIMPSWTFKEVASQEQIQTMSILKIFLITGDFWNFW